MNLPLVLDVVLGSTFIYLILSLLASEIQELITTLLQWRAKHLKKAIEILLSGGSEDSQEVQDINQAINLANHIYRDPLINTLNQGDRGAIGSFFRKCTKIFNLMENRIFGNKTSGPSYINSETFSTTLMGTLKIPELSQKLSESKLKNFQSGLLEETIKGFLSRYTNLDDTHLLAKSKEAINSILENPNITQTNRIILKDFYELKDKLEEINKNFQQGKSTLTTSIDRMEERLDRYIENAKAIAENDPTTKDFFEQLESLKQDMFGTTQERRNAEKALILKGLKPTLTEIVKVYQEAKEQINLAEAENNPSYKLLKEIHGNMEDLFSRLPQPVLDSLQVLADRATTKIENTEEDINQLRQEIGTWFDRSMERASGVYKRNSKGVAILIGLVIATSTNADTFHIVNTLSKDADLRKAITENATQVTNDRRNLTEADLTNIKNQVDQALSGIPLPLGWDSINTAGQDVEGKGWPIPWLKRFVGWLLSGIAISMGAPFWFDLLGKVVNVRNAGKPSKSESD